MVAFRSGAVNPPIKEKIYRDLGITFNPHPVTKKVKILENEEAIKRAIKNLILTNKGEKPFRPLYGGNITAFLFENFDASTEQNIKSRIARTVNTYEPRVNLIGSEVKANEDNNLLDIKIFFEIIATNRIVETSFTVERIR